METSEQQRRPAIGQFAKTLADAQLDFDAIDLADMLWLAQFMEPAKAVQPTSQPQPSSQTRSTVEAGNLEIHENALNLYSDSANRVEKGEPVTDSSQQESEPVKSTPFAVPAAPALRTQLDLARALRPLMRKVPSQTRFDLDEEKTVTQIAETEVWLPVVQPRPERWLELDLVVEASKTTAIWERAIAELNHLVEYQGAFRAVRTWRLQSVEGQVKLFPRWRDRIDTSAKTKQAEYQRPHTPRELIDPTGRRLIWLVTDCTSLLWRGEAIYQTLRQWAAVQPITIVQMFPDSLWPRTALRDGHIVRLSAFASGLPTARLEIEGLPQRLERRGRRDLVTVPIISVNAVGMQRWAKVVSGSGDIRTPGRTFDLAFIRRQADKRQAEPQAVSASRPAPQRTAQERVTLFRSTASATAQQLANLMAAVPVSLPVIDLLRDAFRADFVEEVRQSHVAEVLLSGLLRRCDTEAEEMCRYEFFGDGSANKDERVRHILLGDTSLSKTLEVLNVLSASICRKLNSPVKSFSALLGELHASDQSELREAALPFARVGLDVLSRLGGEYATLARRYTMEQPDTIGEKKAETSADEFPLEDITDEVVKLERFPPLQPYDYESVTIATILDRFDFETATIERDRSTDWTIQRRPGIAWGYTEALSGEIGLDMVAIPDGSFLMGAPAGEPNAGNAERPQHEVTLQSFYLGRYPVTQAQWRVVASYNPIDRDLKPNPSNFEGDNCPVEQVSWEEAVEFCKRLSARTGKDYRLPSESQWEYACRARTETPFHFGDTLSSELANYRGNSTYNNGPKGAYRQQTTEVGSFPGNNWGLHDMHGNVWEWCEDTWPSNYEEAPTDGSAWTEGGSNRRLLRGGSWIRYPGVCRSAFRYYDSRDDRIDHIGFRVCCVAPRASS